MTDVEFPASVVSTDQLTHLPSSDDGATTTTSTPSKSTLSTAPSPRSNNSNTRKRDPIFWTELEIRRLSNLVAEAIHSARYTGPSPDAVAERRRMRVYIDAMKRKAMRVLLRAEQCASARGGQAVWPGIDATIVDPVTLAEEYVKLVEDYLAVLEAAETEAEAAAEAEAAVAVEAEGEGLVEGAVDVEGDGDGGGRDASKEEWEVEDDNAYRKALERQRDNGAENSGSTDREGSVSENAEREQESYAQERRALLETAEGVRRRKGAGTSSADGGSNMEKDSSTKEEDEELMKKQRPIQEELTSNLANLVGQLKESVTVNRQLLQRDEKVLDEAEVAVERNVEAVGRQREELGKFSVTAATSWWVMLGAAVIIVLVFVFVLLLLNVPI